MLDKDGKYGALALRNDAGEIYLPGGPSRAMKAKPRSHLRNLLTLVRCFERGSKRRTVSEFFPAGCNADCSKHQGLAVNL